MSRSTLPSAIFHPYLSFLEQALHSPEGSLAPAPRSKPVALWRKVALKDRFDHVTQGRLHDAVSHGRHSQRTLFCASLLRDPHPFDPLRLVVLCS